MGNPVEFTIRELAETVLDMVGGSSKLIMLPLPQDDPKQRKPDIGVAQRTLDWAPKVQLRQGLEKTIQYFRQLQQP
jgi:UDP-glucuronate decarboxylase